MRNTVNRKRTDCRSDSINKTQHASAANRIRKNVIISVRADHTVNAIAFILLCERVLYVYKFA